MSVYLYESTSLVSNRHVYTLHNCMSEKALYEVQSDNLFLQDLFELRSIYTVPSKLAMITVNKG